VDFIAEEVCREAEAGHYVASLATDEGKNTFVEQMRAFVETGTCYGNTFGTADFDGYIAELDGKKAGFSVFWTKDNVSEIWYFGLSTQFRGQKLGRELLDKTIYKIDGSKAIIFARCLAASTGMMHMLKKKGFHLLGEEKGVSILCNKHLKL
jgi:ribosomal protein S18 acetylase RimI-like enzyme